MSTEPEQELTLADEKPVAVIPRQEVSPMQLIQVAVQNDYPIEKLEKLMDLKDRHEAAEAKKAFDHAMSGFRGEAVQIIKRKRAAFDHRSGGGRTEYAFADLADSVDAAVPALSKWGLSHSWDTEQLDGDQIKVTCELTHEQGHSKKTSLQASPDTSGSKNPIQAMASAVSYLERYTFLAICGLAAKGMDDDGISAAAPKEPELLNEAQCKEIDKLLKDIGADRDKFFQWCSNAQHQEVTELKQIKAANYEPIMLNLKRQKKAQNSENQAAE